MNVDQILETFNRGGVAYILIGGMSFLLRRAPVLTYDVDVWIEDTLEVGGIGILAVMLISVRERTGEIGLRRAVGARRSDIRTQFLLESGLLAAAGGLLGVIGGVAPPWVCPGCQKCQAVVHVIAVAGPKKFAGQANL